MDEQLQRARTLMHRINACYTRCVHRQVLDLERLLWSLEHHHEALGEDEELQVDDGEAGVEEQFIALWHAYSYGDIVCRRCSG